MANKQKYVVTIGYISLAFDEKKVAMQAYSILSESTPCETFWLGSNVIIPDHMKGIQYVRKEYNVDLDLKRIDINKFALHLTEEEFKEKCKPQPTEVDGEARLIADQHVPAIEAPADVEDATDVEFL